MELEDIQEQIKTVQEVAALHGGSINIFYIKEIKKGQFSVNGGTGGKSEYNGGAGGDGTVTIGKILNGTFVKDEN